MSEMNSESLHKEFELERIILFSDAVFAIAITLLIIEIKFPELPDNYRVSLDLFKMFKPTLLQFLGFTVSFVIIGFSWARHLNTFRYLKGYDNGLIFRNLLSLFFIVSFPFSASGLLHFRPSSFLFPMIIYMGNVMLIAASNFLLVHYIFKKKLHLTTAGHEAEKKYIYIQSMAQAVTLAAAFTVVFATALISGNNTEYVNDSFYIFLPVAIIIRLVSRKYKPKKTAA